VLGEDKLFIVLTIFLSVLSAFAKAANSALFFAKGKRALEAAVMAKIK